MLDLDAIRARLAAITRAPWSLDPDSPWVLDLRGHILIGSDEFDDILDPENAAFIAAAPAAVAALLAEVARLRAAMEHTTRFLATTQYLLDAAGQAQLALACYGARQELTQALQQPWPKGGDNHARL